MDSIGPGIFADTKTEVMVEFAVRIVLAGGLVALSGWTGAVPFEAAWQIALAVAGYGFLFYAIERRRKSNPGIAGLAAGMDALAIGASVGYAGHLDTLGFMVLAPVIYAVAKRGSNPVAMGPIAAAAVMFADSLISGNHMPSVAILAQTVGILLVTLMANQPRVVVRPKTIQQMIADMGEPMPDTGAQALIELREKYRRVTSSYKELERRSRIDRIRSNLFLSRTAHGDTAHLLETLRTMLDAMGLMLFLTNQQADRMTVTASAGQVPQHAESSSFSISGKEAAQQLRHRAHEAMHALHSAASDEIRSCNVLLKTKGKVVGLLTAYAADEQKLEEIRERAEEASEAVAQILQEDLHASRIQRRLAESELLYEMVCRLDGAASEADLGRRAARALAEILHPDHISVWLLDGTRPILAGKEGKTCTLFEGYKFEPLGIEGWLTSGAPPILAYDTAQSQILDTTQAAKDRIGSYVAVPIVQGDAAVGFIVAATSAHGRLGPQDAETMNDVACELANALVHATSLAAPVPAKGLVSLAEFQREVIENPAERSCIVYLEPLHFEELEPTLGKPLIELAARQLGLIIKRNSPKDAGICRKGDGTFVALLPNCTLEQAQEWAAHVTALVSLRAFERDSGETRIPLAIRARAADLSQKPEKSAGVFEEVT